MKHTAQAVAAVIRAMSRRVGPQPRIATRTVCHASGVGRIRNMAHRTGLGATPEGVDRLGPSSACQLSSVVRARRRTTVFLGGVLAFFAAGFLRALPAVDLDPLFFVVFTDGAAVLAECFCAPAEASPRAAVRAAVLNGPVSL